jgi:membrane associated rhomboid family serine protease
MKIELSQTSAQTITRVKDQPGVLRYVFNEPATNDGLLIFLIQLMVLFYALTIGLSAFANSTGIGWLFGVANFIFSNGAMTNDVWAGQIWRPITSAFLHGSTFHILGNAINFFFVALATRIVFAHRGWLTIFVVSAYLGCLLAILSSPDATMVGASVGLMGLFGALIAGELRLKRVNHKERPVARLISLRILLIVLTLQLVLEHLIPNVGHVAHAAGLLIGFLVGLILPLNSGLELWISRKSAIEVRTIERITRGDQTVHAITFVVAPDFDQDRDFLAVVQGQHGKQRISAYRLLGTLKAPSPEAWHSAFKVADRFDVTGFEKPELPAEIMAALSKKAEAKPLLWRILSMGLMCWLWSTIFASWVGDMTMDEADLQWLHFLPLSLAEPAISIGSILGAIVVSGSYAFFIFSIMEGILYGLFKGFFKPKNKPDEDSKPVKIETFVQQAPTQPKQP